MKAIDTLQLVAKVSGENPNSANPIPVSSFSRFPVSIAVAIVLIAAAPHMQGQITYSVTDLGTLGGSSSAAYALNNSGQVVGVSATAGGAQHAFLYNGGEITDLGTLGGGFSQANGISDDGYIVGVASTSAGAPLGFLYSGGTMTDLNTLTTFGFSPGGGNYTVTNATAINGTMAGSGLQIVGEASETGIGFGSVGPQAVLVSASGGPPYMGQALGNLGGPFVNWSEVNAVDSYGSTPVGWSLTAAGRQDACVFGGTTSDLNPANSSNGLLLYSATAVDDTSDIAGDALTTNVADHAFLATGGTAIDLGTLPGGNKSLVYGMFSAVGVNFQMVGMSTGSGFLGSNAMLCTALRTNAAPMVNLNALIPSDSGWRLYVATAINSHGQIVGWGLSPAGQIHGFLMTATNSLPQFPLPGLTISQSGANIIMSWPSTGSYTLQQNSDLTATAGWVASADAISTSDGTNSVTITPSQPNLFFRLSYP